jgi:hypothetical protein
MRVTDTDETKSSGNNPNTAIHEIVHLGIEENIVRKYRLTHEEKERLVDLICEMRFKKLYPENDLQKRGDSRIDEFITLEALNNNLPLAVENYVKKYPRA